MAYIGQNPFQEFSSIPTKDSFTGDGSATAFDLANDVVRGAENALEVFVNNVRQEPGSGKAFTLGVDGSNNYRRITFTAAPANGASIYVINDKTNLSTIAPLNTDFNGVEIVLDADADTTLHAETDDQIDLRIAGVDVAKFLQSSGDLVIKPMVDARDIIFQQFDGNKVFEINDGNFVGVGGNSTQAGEIRIFEDSDNGTNYSGFKAAASTTGSVAYTLPAADGSSGTHLTTDGSGILSWTASLSLANDTNNRVVTGTGSGLNGEANLTFDGSTLAVTGAITGSSDLTLQDDLILDSDAAVLSFGDDQDVTLTHVADTGLLLNSTMKLQFNDASQFIHAPSATVLDIAATDEIELTATLIDVVGNLTTSGTIVSTGTITGTLATAAQGNITSLGTLTALTVDDVAVDGKVITMTGSTDDTFVTTVAANGATSLVTTDAGGAAGHLTITADGTVDINSASTLTLDSGAAINIEPASGSAILLDGTISIDAGVVTGATSITSTAFVGDITGDVTGTADVATVATTVTITDNESTNESNALIFTAGGDVDGGNIGLESDGTLTYNPSTGKVTATGFVGTLTGNVTGNASGTALTVTQAAQSSITSLGTLTTLTVDDITINGSTISDAGDLTLDVGGDIILDAAGNDFIFASGGTNILKILNSSSDLIFKPQVDGKDIIFQQYDGTSVLEINDGAGGQGFAKFTAAAFNAEVALTDASTVSWNALTAPVAKVTLGGNRTLGAASGVQTGQFISILFIQDGTGSRTMTFNAAYEHTGDVAPVLTTTANKGDLFVYRYNGAKFLEVGRNLNLTLS